MKKKYALGIILGMGIVGIGYFATQRTTEPPANEVGRLVSREHIISIFTNGNQNLYSVSTRDGKLLESLLDESALEKEFPNVYRDLKTGIAGDNEIWAGLDLDTHQWNRSGAIRQVPPSFD
ncbi:MAG: hypothetical protein P1U89_17755 [Verrucomicrobiales bacterium]|nr:hypothetical protein [Verrucomicrobiales bacterium]